jgi:hypothetical protein
MVRAPRLYETERGESWEGQAVRVYEIGVKLCSVLSMEIMVGGAARHDVDPLTSEGIWP